jgi:hypothetical protein
VDRAALEVDQRGRDLRAPDVEAEGDGHGR